MKRNKTLRIAAILLALVLVSTCGMVGTLAKYVTDFDMTTNWVRAGLFKVDKEGDFTAALGVTLLDGDGSTETNAKKYDGGLNIIVPGSIVTFDDDLTIKNFSEVDVKIALKSIAMEYGPEGSEKTAIPKLMFASDISAASTKSGWYSSITALQAAIDTANATTPGTMTEILPAANANLRAQTGTLTVKPNLYILWPYQAAAEAVAAPAFPGYVDTGSSAANAALPAADVKAINATTAGGTNVLSKDNQDGNPYGTDTTIGEAQADDLLTGANNGFVNAATDYEFAIKLTITATQID